MTGIAGADGGANGWASRDCAGVGVLVGDSRATGGAGEGLIGIEVWNSAFIADDGAKIAVFQADIG